MSEFRKKFWALQIGCNFNVTGKQENACQIILIEKNNILKFLSQSESIVTVKFFY